MVRSLTVDALPAQAKRLGYHPFGLSINRLTDRDCCINPSRMTTTSGATEKRTALLKQIEALNSQIDALNVEAVHELKLKLSDARKVVVQLEDELESLTGKPTGLPRVRRERRPAITDEALKDQLLKVMASHGKEGMNAKQLADKLNQDPLRVRKFIKENPKTLKRQGTGPGTKFFLP